MILELGVELVKGAFPQRVIALHKEAAVGALRERPLLAFLVDQDAELHVDIGQLRKGVVVAIECRAPEGEKTLFFFRKHMRLHPADLAQPDLPLRKRGVFQELGELLVRDRLDFRDDE